MLTACRGGPEPAGEAAKKDAGGQAKATPSVAAGLMTPEGDLLARAYEGLGCMRDQLKNDQGRARGVRAAHPAPHRAGRGELHGHRGLQAAPPGVRTARRVRARRRDFPLAFAPRRGERTRAYASQ